MGPYQPRCRTNPEFVTVMLCEGFINICSQLDTGTNRVPQSMRLKPKQSVGLKCAYPTAYPAAYSAAYPAALAWI